MSKQHDHSLHGHHIGTSHAGEDLSERLLSGKYIGVSFEDTNLRGASLIGTFINSSFRGADLRDADTSTAKFVNNDFTDAKMSDGKSR